MKYFLVLLAMVSISCQKKYRNTSVVWTPQQGEAPVVREDLKNSVIAVKTKTETVERFVQKIGEAEVEDSFLQIVKNKKNESVFLKMTYSDHQKSFLLKEIQKLVQNKQTFLHNLKARVTEISTASHLSPIKVIFSNAADKPQLFYQLDSISKDGAAAYRWKVSTNYKILDKTQASSYFDGHGMVYPNGPHWSQIEDVILPNLVGDGTLTSSHLVVKTQSDLVAISPQQVFDFKPDDPRFDQVQVFHFAEKTIQLFKSRLGVELPFKVEFKTHIGAPELKTVMFYHDRSIRLGQGDGVNYKNILKDPTIVMHEMSHAFVDALSGLPQGSVNEAFADFFTTSFLNHPHLGEVSYQKGTYVRTLENQLTAKEKKNTVYGDSQILSGTLWEIRKLVGAEKAEQYALQTLIRLGPNGTFDDFGPTLWSVVESNGRENDKTKIQKVLEQRQFLNSEVL